MKVCFKGLSLTMNHNMYRLTQNPNIFSFLFLHFFVSLLLKVSYCFKHVSLKIFRKTMFKFIKKKYLYVTNVQEVLDFEEWIFNITEANLFPNENPIWYKLYSFKDAYGMDNLHPSSFADLLNRMAQSKELMQQYYRYIWYSFKHCQNMTTIL